MILFRFGPSLNALLSLGAKAIIHGSRQLHSILGDVMIEIIVLEV